MNRIEQTFSNLKQAGRKALITFITAGDPDETKSAAILHALGDAGADIIEIGMPFTDPMADGPVIQAASLRALQNGMNVRKTLSMLQNFRSKNDRTPVVLMGYFNPVLAYGAQAFCKDAAESGADGLILVDLPPEESGEIAEFARSSGLHLIRLLTPTTDEARLPAILDGAGGFLYYVSITGVTGTASADAASVGRHIAQIRKSTSLPIVAGFGIKTPDDTRAMARAGVDGVVIGSSIVEKIVSYQNDNALPRIISEQVKAFSAVL